MISILVVFILFVIISFFAGFSMGLNLGIRQKMTKHLWRVSYRKDGKPKSIPIGRICVVCGEVQKNSNVFCLNGNDELWYTEKNGDYTKHM